MARHAALSMLMSGRLASRWRRTMFRSMPPVRSSSRTQPTFLRRSSVRRNCRHGLRSSRRTPVDGPRGGSLHSVSRRSRERLLLRTNLSLCWRLDGLSLTAEQRSVRSRTVPRSRPPLRERQASQTCQGETAGTHPRRVRAEPLPTFRDSRQHRRESMAGG